MNRFSNANIFLFPYDRVPRNSRVIIWGKGNVGTQYYKALKAIHYAENIEWIDTNSIDDEQKIIETGKQSFFVIGILSEKIRNEITNKLLALGVDEKFIINDKPRSIIFTPTWCKISEKKELELFDELVKKEIKKFYKLSTLKRVVGYDFLRVGGANDGGYVMLNDLPGGIAYSFGINDDVSWDDDMASRGYEVYMYDHTIDALPHVRKAFHFFKEGIADFEENKSLKKLETFIKRNKHDKNENMILKIDVEGAEWGVFENISEDILKAFNQIVVEFHNLCEFNNISRYNKVLEKIHRTHQPIHYHINNYDDVYWFSDKPYGNAIEVTFASKQKYNFIDGKIKLPRSQDAPNCKDIDEIIIGTF